MKNNLNNFLKQIRDSLVGIPQVTCNFPIITLGNKGGEKTMLAHGQPGRVISAGAGTDISWEIETLHKFQANITLCDPTSISNSLVSNFIASTSYVELTRKTKRVLNFLPLALWNELTTLPMYPPKSA